MQIAIRAFGNSKGIVLPKALLSQAGLSVADAADVEVLGGAIVIKALPAIRKGWAQSAAAIAAADDDRLVMGEFSNAGDHDLAWDPGPDAASTDALGHVQW